MLNKMNVFWCEPISDEAQTALFNVPVRTAL